MRGGLRGGLRGGRLPVLGTRVHRRPLLVGLVVAAALLALALVALGTGDYPLSPSQVVAAVLDPGAGFERTVVLEWRLPRVLAALAFGAALGASGAVFQSLTRNPLGSPDVIGFSTGAYTGALLSLTVLSGGASAAFSATTGSATGSTGGGASTTAGALVGGMLTAAAVYALARVRGSVQGYRLVVVGIAATAVLHAVNTYLLLRAQTEVAMAGAVWGAGSLSLVGWGDLRWALAALAALLPLLALLSAALRQLELGDDAASAHGVPVERARLALVVVGVALVSVVTASTGPIAFVALAAPQVARLVLRGAGLPLVGSALVGALLLLSADQVAQRFLSGVPVGVVTVVGGGVYLLVLLLARPGRGRRTA
ncbi:iron chelate uptake ABC transporter family permease subunit [Streptomyces sp. NP160]|nr:iron chelate uptake ABC transporter family permease subunit [Streptomyces sp. NP160]